LKESSKKKRSREEIEEVKLEEDLLKRDKQGFLREFKKLKENHSGNSGTTIAHKPLEKQLWDMKMKGPDEYEEKGNKRKPKDFVSLNCSYQ
jgi:hypothetical protein